LIKDEIVKAQVPIIMSPLKNLPGNFDSLHASLTNAAQLSNAGVNIIFSPNGDAHNLNQLRFDAGIAVANGFDYVEAIKALTANVADAFQLNAGRIEAGKQANIVLWSADPFELSSGVQQMWINGVETSTVSRQDALRDRYMTKSDMPKAYLNIKQN
jgi:imidazolonepropionase-like amidohydrolase